MTYKQVRRRVRGRPLGDVFSDWTREQIEARFWSKVDKNGPTPDRPELGNCHVWTGDHTTHGYGLLRRVGAHRVALWLATGEDSDGRHACHRCDNPPCVRREHLYWGTRDQNMEDMAGRGRSARPTKIEDEQAEEIRQRYASGDPSRTLAAQYDLSMAQVNRIVMGLTRKLEPIDLEWKRQGFRRPDQKLTPSDHEEIKRRHAAGESNGSLARAFGISTGYVSELARGRKKVNRKANPKIRPTAAFTVDEVRQVRRLAAEGVRRGEIAARFGVHPGTVSRLLAGASYKDVA